MKTGEIFKLTEAILPILAAHSPRNPNWTAHLLAILIKDIGVDDKKAVADLRKLLSTWQKDAARRRRSEQ